MHYAFSPAYGVPKAGTDKMAADMAVDFRDFGIATVSIWMGSLLTDRVKQIIASNPDKFGHILDTAETPELTGHVIWALYKDPGLMSVSGQTLLGAELAVKYGITDDGGRQPPSYRELFDVHPIGRVRTSCADALSLSLRSRLTLGSRLHGIDVALERLGDFGVRRLDADALLEVQEFR